MTTWKSFCYHIASPLVKKGLFYWLSSDGGPQDTYLFIKLQSGRALNYQLIPRPKHEENWRLPSSIPCCPLVLLTPNVVCYFNFMIEILEKWVFIGGVNTVPFLGILPSFWNILLWVALGVFTILLPVLPKSWGILFFMVSLILRAIYTMGLGPALLLLGTINVSDATRWRPIPVSQFYSWFFFSFTWYISNLLFPFSFSTS